MNRSQIRTSTFLPLLTCLFGCGEAGTGRTSPKPATASERKINYSEVFPDSPDGEFYQTLRQSPEWKVSIDLRNPADVAGLPSGVKWFPMGDQEFCAMQGTTGLNLTLPSGQVIREEFAIVYVDRDHEGIFRVRADSLGWLKIPVALQRLDRELKFFATAGADPPKLNHRSTEIRRWMENFDHNSNMYEGIGVRSDASSASFSFFVTMTTELGIRYCYEAEIPRSKERRKANQNPRQTKAK